MRKTGIGTGWYAVYQSSYWLSLCSIAPFASAFLVERGFSPSQVGITASLASLLSFVLAPAAGSFADRNRNGFPVRIIMLSALFGLVLEIGLFFRLPLLLTAGMYLLTMCSVFVNQPLVSSVCVYYKNRGSRVNFGIARGIGSGAYAVFSYLLGLLVARSGYWVLMAFGIAMFLLLILMSALLKPTEGIARAEVRQAEAGVPASLRDMPKRYPVFFLLLSGVMLLFVFHTYVTTLFYQIVVSVGGDTAAMGFSNALCAAVEVPLMFAYAYLAKRFGTGRVLACSAVFFAVKAAVFLLARDMLTVNLAQCFQALSYAVYTPACIEFTDRIMLPADQNKGQTLAVAAQTAGSILGSLTGGVLIDRFGVRAMLTAGLLCASAGAVIVVIACRRGKDRLRQD